jgi:hypothetical protein
VGGGATEAKGKTALSEKDEEVKLTSEADAIAKQRRKERNGRGPDDRNGK